MSAQPLILAASLLLLGGVMLSKTSSRFGVPSLLLFLGLGMLAGSDGLLGIEFDDFEVARTVGVIALAFILFSGGLDTSWPALRAVLGPGVALASVGVLVSAMVLGASAAWILGLEPMVGMLLGAIIASTDAAAVFSILRSRGVRVEGKLRPLLELESGSNDPAAVFLTIGILAVIEGDGPDLLGLVGIFVVQMGVGAVAGLVMARGAVWVINRARLDFDGLYPVMTVGLVLLIFEGTTALGGSGFLAAYVAGLVLGNHEFLHKRSLKSFHDAIAWLMQIAMFVLLGLLVFPSDLPSVALRALAIALVVMLVARPLAVILTLLPFRLPWRQVGFVSWVGLRGATPIILATFPVVEGLDDAETIFNVVFFVVLTSVLLQGTTIPRAAQLFGVTSDELETRSSDSIDAVISGRAGHALHEVTVPPGSAADGTPIVSLDLPQGVLIALLQRGDDFLVPEGRTIVHAGDHLLLLAGDDGLVEARRIIERP